MDKTAAERRVREIVDKPTADLMDLSFDCVCGEHHTIPVKHLDVRAGALDGVSGRLRELGLTGRGGVVFDRKIEKSVVSDLRTRLADQGLDLRSYPHGDGNEKIPPEIGRARALADEIDGSVDYLVSIGSGVISDLTKKAADFLGIPYALIGTAPSMNGYTSSMAALTDEGIKQTLLLPCATAIFADIDVMRNAPIEMIRSGLGDIVSKSICNADWKLSQLVKKTYFCPIPFRITDKTENRYLSAAEEIGARTAPGILELTDGVMRSGLSMTVIGTSTPSSGAEHLISHYWDLIALIEDGEKLFHGVQVGVATLMIGRLYRFVRDVDVSSRVDMKSLEEAYPDRKEVESFIDGKFGGYAGGIREAYFSKYVDWPEKRREIEFVVDRWTGLWDELDPYIRPLEPIENALRASGAAAAYQDLGFDREQARDAVMNARFIRGRYSILDLAADIGILEEGAEAIL
jgi:glycerol-1-phosphate dehydrogenase [NAD(P)+]